MQQLDQVGFCFAPFTRVWTGCIEHLYGAAV